MSIIVKLFLKKMFEVKSFRLNASTSIPKSIIIGLCFAHSTMVCLNLSKLFVEIFRQKRLFQTQSRYICRTSVLTYLKHSFQEDKLIFFEVYKNYLILVYL